MAFSNVEISVSKSIVGSVAEVEGGVANNRRSLHCRGVVVVGHVARELHLQEKEVLYRPVVVDRSGIGRCYFVGALAQEVGDVNLVVISVPTVLSSGVLQCVSVQVFRLDVATSPARCFVVSVVSVRRQITSAAAAYAMICTRMTQTLSVRRTSTVCAVLCHRDTHDGGGVVLLAL